MGALSGSVGNALFGCVCWGFHWFMIRVHPLPQWYSRVLLSKHKPWLWTIMSCDVSLLWSYLLVLIMQSSRIVLTAKLSTMQSKNRFQRKKPSTMQSKFCMWFKGFCLQLFFFTTPSKNGHNPIHIFWARLLQAWLDKRMSSITSDWKARGGGMSELKHTYFVPKVY